VTGYEILTGRSWRKQVGGRGRVGGKKRDEGSGERERGPRFSGERGVGDAWRGATARVCWMGDPRPNGIGRVCRRVTAMRAAVGWRIPRTPCAVCRPPRGFCPIGSGAATGGADRNFRHPAMPLWGSSPPQETGFGTVGAAHGGPRLPPGA
jgi:hypothetical protein